jgi:translation initiation factor 5B
LLLETLFIAESFKSPRATLCVMAMRSPIVSVLGHVDHGKSSILDAIRGTNILATEAGAITQAIGASIVPLDVIKRKCGPLIEAMKLQFTIPGLLFIDTPGHAAFTNLRKRGGNLADIAVVVVDINEGFRPQTIEAIEILRSYKTPFLIAANKIDLIPGYKKKADLVLKDVASQDPAWITAFETKMYEIVGKMHEKFGMESERFDRVENFTRQIGIIPTSALSSHGISELLVMLTGLAQKFLEESLKLESNGPAKGTVLEVKETQGFGMTVDAIIYDGVIKVNDTLIIGGVDAPIVTKVKAILEPNPLQEMRDKKSKYRSIKEATAATGLKIAAPDLDKAIAGMPMRVAITKQDVERISADIQAEVDEVLVATDKEGIIIKADTLGSLEALSVLLREKEIKIRKASVGAITKKDLVDAESNIEQDPLTAVILGFNIPREQNDRVKIITSDVIYRLIDELEAWQNEERKKQEAKELDAYVRPAKIEVLQNCIFRQSNPCVVGIEVVFGTLKTGMPIMNKEGKTLANIKSIERSKESVQSIARGEQAAISLPNVMAGRQIFEHDVLYSSIPEEQFRELKKLHKFMGKDELQCLKEIAELKRKENPLWGV